MSVIDSTSDEEVVLGQNPANPTPESIRNLQRVVPVEYIGFDGLIHQGQIVVHRDVVGDVLDFFSLARNLRFLIQSVIPLADSRFNFDDTKSCDANNTSGFSYRVNTTNPTKLSYHAYGAAFDINPVQNPYMRYDGTGIEVERIPRAGAYILDASGTLTDNQPLVQMLESRGWVWGGRWNSASGRIDYQHFEKHILTL